MEELFSLYEVRACILESEDLRRALRVLDEALANYSSLHTDERLEDIRMDYSRMKDFVLRGFRDALPPAASQAFCCGQRHHPPILSPPQDFLHDGGLEMPQYGHLQRRYQDAP